MSEHRGDDRPLVSNNPSMAAARERAHPTPTTDPQVIGDLDRLQLAERELAAGLGITREGSAAELAMVHQSRAAELCELIHQLGGAPSQYGLRELPHEPEQLGGLADRRSIYAALAKNAGVLAELYSMALEHAEDVELARPVLERNGAQTRADAGAFEAIATPLH